MAMKCIRHKTAGFVARTNEAIAEQIVKIGFAEYSSKEVWKQQGRLYYVASKDNPLGGKVIQSKK